MTALLVIIGIIILLFFGVQEALKFCGIVLGFMIMGWWFLIVLVLLYLFF